MTTFEIRTELADRYCVKPEQVRCSNCKYWGYNQGKIMNSMGESRCMKRKDEKTWCRQFCRGFVPKK